MKEFVKVVQNSFSPTLSCQREKQAVLVANKTTTHLFPSTLSFKTPEADSSQTTSHLTRDSVSIIAKRELNKLYGFFVGPLLKTKIERNEKK